MDGSDDIYMHIAPEWDGEDDRFDITKLSEAELKHHPSAKICSKRSEKCCKRDEVLVSFRFL